MKKIDRRKIVNIVEETIKLAIFEITPNIEHEIRRKYQNYNQEYHILTRSKTVVFEIHKDILKYIFDAPQEKQFYYFDKIKNFFKHKYVSFDHENNVDTIEIWRFKYNIYSSIVNPSGLPKLNQAYQKSR